MSEITFDYPFDPTGTQASNKITGEKHVLSPPAWKDYHFIVPKMAPFFRDSIKLRKLPSGDPLVEGVDYVVTHLFHDASLAIAKPIYGSITFYDKEFDGVVEIVEYQTLGGEWTVDEDTITEILVNNAINPRITTWEQVVETPREFPVIDHQWHLDDMVGMSEVEAAILRISDVLLATGDPEVAIDDHLKRTDNPHDVTKTQVGLGNLDNYATATRSEAEAGSSAELFMTPQGVRYAIEKIAFDHTNTHEKRDDNPHGVTKAQVGLSAVQNYPVATQTESETGASNTRYMTPLRTKQAIDKQAIKPLQDHVGDTGNPHNVTKAQVGLGQVQNYAVASEEEAADGTSNEAYMTPARTRHAIEQIANQSSGAHAGRTDNPHNVTIEQVGGYSTTAIDQKLEDLDGNVVAKDTNAFGGKTAAEWSAELDGTQSTSDLILLLDERFMTASTQIGSLEAPEFQDPVGVPVIDHLAAGLHSHAVVFNNGEVNFSISSDDYVDFGTDDMTGITSVAIGETAVYVAFQDGTLKGYGSRAHPTPTLGSGTVLRLYAGKDAAVAMLTDNTLVAWGDPAKSAYWDIINTDLNTNVFKPVLGYGDNGAVVFIDNTARAFGHTNFVANVNALLQSFDGDIVDMAMGTDQFLIRLDDGTIRAWDVTDPDGAASLTEITLPQNLRKGIAVSGWADVFGIVTNSGFFYLWGDTTPSVDTEAVGMVDMIEMGAFVAVVRDVYNEHHYAPYTL